jgi:Zn-dependent protease
VDTSWALGVVLVTYSLWLRFSVVYEDLDGGPGLALAAMASVLFFGSVLVHELAHAGMALVRGIPVSGITLFLFGGATGARLEDRGPRDEFLVTVVGPGSSLALAGIFYLVSNTGEVIGEPVAGAFGYVGWVNLLLAVFNVVPGFPLDGGRMLRSILWRVTGNMKRATRIAATVGQGVALLLIGFGIWRAIVGNTVGGLWAAAIGWMLFQAARSSTRDHGMRRLLSQATVAEAMGPPPRAIPAEISLSESLDAYLMGHERETFPVVEDGVVVGLLDFRAARKVGRNEPFRPVRDAMRPVSEGLVVRPDDRLDDVVERLGNGRAALVLRDGMLEGSVTPRDISRWLAARASR